MLIKNVDLYNEKFPHFTSAFLTTTKFIIFLVFIVEWYKITTLNIKKPILRI